MGTVKLAAALPKEAALNGLGDHTATLLRHPADEYVIVARVSVKQIVDDRWEGIRVPVIGVVAIELLADDDEDTARVLMDRAKDKRYARAPLRAALQRPGELPFDPETGEKRAVVTGVTIDPSRLPGGDSIAGDR